MAKQPDPAQRDAFQARAERDWKNAFRGNTKERPSFKKKRAGIDLAQAEIISFLADDSLARTRTPAESAASLGDDLPAGSDGEDLWAPEHTSVDGDEYAAAQADAMEISSAGGPLAERLEQMAEQVIVGTLEDIRQELGGTIPKSVKVALADHFWCDLLAQLAHAIDTGLKLIDSVPDRLTEWVMRSRERSHWRYIEERVVRAAARSMWNKLKNVMFSGILNRVIALPIIRVLGVLMCKAPERHQAVVEYCVDPLRKQLSAKIKECLVKVLADWLPQMRGSIYSDRRAGSRDADPAT